MILRFLAVCAVLLLSACGQMGPLYHPDAAPPPPKPLVVDNASGHTEPAAITVPPPRPAVADPDGASPASAEDPAAQRKEDVNVVPPMGSDAGSTPTQP